MLKIYICAPIKHSNYTENLAKKLEMNGFHTSYAAKDTDQSIAQHEIFESNIRLIDDCDVFISYFVHDGYYGIDFASEAGYAAKNKKVIGFIEVREEHYDQLMVNMEKDIMLSHFIDVFFEEFKDLIAYLGNL